MKNIYKFSAHLLIILVYIFITKSVIAQVPQKLSYQAVIRDGSNKLVTDLPVGMRISILKGSSSGSEVYVETQNASTNANGLLTIEIGTGTTTDNFANIDWSAGSYFIKTETDPSGGTNYDAIVGTSQLLSVPYALHAKTAETISGTIRETDPVFSDSPAANLISNDISNLSNLSGVNTGDQDLQWKVDKEPGRGLTPYGTVSGQMLYWNGISWIAIAPGQHDQTLRFCEGVPTWGPCPAIEPNVTTEAASLVSMTSALCGGNVTYDGGSSVIARGVCWNTSPNPTLANSNTTNGMGTGEFISNLIGLTPNTTYYARAYASSLYGGTSYGAQITFSTTSVHLISVGVEYQGGIIAYILQAGDPGYNANVQHGLIVATTDQSTSMHWWNGSLTVTGATGLSLGTGNANTNTIVSSQGAGTYAAKLCADLVVGIYSDWYLPSRDELNKVFLIKAIVGNLGVQNYWSSSEARINQAWKQEFIGGLTTEYEKNWVASVRAIRSF